MPTVPSSHGGATLTPPGGAPPVLEVAELSKRYPPALDALRGVSFTLREGEVLALLGANGAGKSTLVKIVSGVERRSGGSVSIDGRAVDFANPGDAQESGIAAVHQELPLLPNPSAAENVFLGTERTPWAIPNGRRRSAAYLRAAEQVPAAPRPDDLIGALSVADRQKVALVRALALEPRLLIIDEGTSSVSAEERGEVSHLIRDIARERRIGVMYITHFVADALEVSDRIVVLRNGEIALAGEASGIAEPSVLDALSPPEEGVRGEGGFAAPSNADRPAGGLRCAGLQTATCGPLDIEVGVGEAVGLYGHPGCGATDLLQGIAGLTPNRGELEWAGRSLPNSTGARVRRNVVYCSGDRGNNLVLGWSIEDNVELPALFERSPFSFPSRRRARREAEAVVERFGVVGEVDDEVRQLSGGNQQKVILGRALLRAPSLLLLGDDITRGVDLVARARLHAMLLEATDAGASLLVFSSDPDELVTLCSRVVLLEEGVPVAELRDDELTSSALERAASSREVGIAPPPSRRGQTKEDA